MMDYFMGFLDEIDEQGILLTHPITKGKTYIFLAHVVAIAEEQILYEDKPEDAKIIEEYRKEKPISAAKGAVKPFVNTPHLADLAKMAQETFK